MRPHSTLYETLVSNIQVIKLITKSFDIIRSIIYIRKKRNALVCFYFILVELWDILDVQEASGRVLTPRTVLQIKTGPTFFVTFGISKLAIHKIAP